MVHSKSRLRFFSLLFFVILMCGTIGYMVVERVSLADAFYFCIVTVATVGYGDIHPLTQAGKIVAIFVIILGVGTFLGVIANTTELMLERREKRSRLEKINIVIGVFFSEVGKELLARFSDADPNLKDIRSKLVVTGKWDESTFVDVSTMLKKYTYSIDISRVHISQLKLFLGGKREFLVGLLESPNLLEHTLFTDVLWAVFHLSEELAYRDDLSSLPRSDLNHIATDSVRAYTYLVHQWLEYMKYLKNNYPYLFSLAMRTNPFDQEASPVVQEPVTL